MLIKHFSHYILNKLTGRKFQVFLTGTVGLFTGFISQENWLILAGIYVGVEGVLDGVAKFRAKPEPEVIEEGVVPSKK